MQYREPYTCQALPPPLGSMPDQPDHPRQAVQRRNSGEGGRLPAATGPRQERLMNQHHRVSDGRDFLTPDRLVGHLVMR